MNPAFVLDASMTLSWVFEDEATSFTDEVLSRLKQISALAPALWPFEVANVLSIAERQGRMQPVQQAEFLEWLRQLPVAIEHRATTWLCQQILPLTRAYRLSAYDAAYLELARREGLPLATLDGDLQTAARAHGVALFEIPVRAPAMRRVRYPVAMSLDGYIGGPQIGDLIVMAVLPHSRSRPTG